MTFSPQNLDSPFVVEGMKHLWDQGRCSYDKHSLNCLYRCSASDGTILKCAVGAFISDEFYSEDFEGLPGEDPEIIQAIKLSMGYTTNKLTLAYLQSFHDGIVEDTFRIDGNHTSISTEDLRKLIVKEVMTRFKDNSPESMLQEISGGTYCEYQ